MWGWIAVAVLCSRLYYLGSTMQKCNDEPSNSAPPLVSLLTMCRPLMTLGRKNRKEKAPHPMTPILHVHVPPVSFICSSALAPKKSQAKVQVTYGTEDLVPANRHFERENNAGHPSSTTAEPPTPHATLQLYFICKRLRVLVK